MVTASRKPSLVVIQLSGGNDAMNTVVPYTNGIYHDSRKTIHLTEENVIDLNGTLGLNPSMGPMKSLWDAGKMAISMESDTQNPIDLTSGLWIYGTLLNQTT